MTRTRFAAIRLAGSVGVLALLLAACVSSEPPPADVAPVAVPAVTTMPATPPEPVTEEIIAAVDDYWDAREAAFAAGADAGLSFVVANNHPLLTYSVEECRDAWFDGEVPPGFAERNDVLADSIESDPGWQMVTGPLAGRDLGQGLITMVVALSYEGDLLRIADRVANVHLQVIGDDVRHFLLCEEPEVIIAAAPTSEATSATTTGGSTTGGSTTGGSTSGGPTGTSTPVTPRPVTPSTTLPPITATPQPTNGGGGNGGDDDDDDDDQPVVCSSEGIEFGPVGDAGEGQPAAGDYGLIPSCDIDNSSGEDGGLSEPSINDSDGE